MGVTEGAKLAVEGLGHLGHSGRCEMRDLGVTVAASLGDGGGVAGGVREQSVQDGRAPLGGALGQEGVLERHGIGGLVVLQFYLEDVVLVAGRLVLKLGRLRPRDEMVVLVGDHEQGDRPRHGHAPRDRKE